MTIIRRSENIFKISRTVEPAAVQSTFLQRFWASGPCKEPPLKKGIRLEIKIILRNVKSRVENEKIRDFPFCFPPRYPFPNLGAFFLLLFFFDGSSAIVLPGLGQEEEERI